MRILTARWIFPVTDPPIEDGAVALEGDRIFRVGRRAELAAEISTGERWDLGEAALLPGLVNCHTHLELGPLPAPAAGEVFVPWVVRLIEQRRGLPQGAQARTAEEGALALIRSGTTCVGEVSSSGQSLAVLLRAGLRGIVYREVLGLDPGEAETRLADAWTEVRAMQESARGGRLAIALSPHSPYALSEALIQACGELVRRTGLSAAMHVAESPAEVAFLTHGAGPIASLLYPAVGCAAPPPRRPARSPAAYLDDLGVSDWCRLWVHAVHADETDCRSMAERGVTVAHCPRSNRRLSEGVAPIPSFLAHGIPVGLGTDSLSSTPSLDLWDEMRAALEVHRGRLTPRQVLGMATHGGAQALGLADRIGSLAPGKQADLIAVAGGHIRRSDPVGSLLEGARGSDVLLSLIDGTICHNRTEVAACA
jgi:cytosine/adenosine deaminase-related metal-dependent hydrolase